MNSVLLECDRVPVGWCVPMFWRNTLISSSRVEGQNHTALTMKRKRSVKTFGRQYPSGKVWQSKTSGSSKAPRVNLNFAKHENLVNLTPHDYQTHALNIWSGNPGFNVFKVLRLKRCSRCLLHKTLLTQYGASHKIEKNEMGGACGAHGEGRGVYRVLVGNQRQRDHWEN